jgi:hypothetical protein
VFESRVQRIFRPKRDGVTGSGEDYIARSFVSCNHHQILFGSSNKEELRGAGQVARMGRREVHTVFWWRKDVRGRDHWETQA